MYGKKNMSLWKCIYNLAMSCKKILLPFVFRIKEINERKKKVKQSRWFQKKEKEATQFIPKRLQYATSLDSKKLWSTKELPEMQKEKFIRQIYKLGKHYWDL